MVTKRKLLLNILIVIMLSLFFCEYLIYYLVISLCNWPQKHVNGSEWMSSGSDVTVMLLSDTHLLGRIKGHPLDKLRREWQMWRSFQTSLQLFKPKIVVILGDIFDEGLWASDQDFDAYVNRFHQLFGLNSETTKLYVVVGNHDIGFHHWTDWYLRRRFELAFNTTDVDLIDAGNDVHLVGINSVALEGDNCYLCGKAVTKLERIGEKLKRKSISPIVLMHFPMYRKSEEICNESDSAPIEEKVVKHREKFDCLSKESTNLIIDILNPRLIFTGHSHHSCVITHRNSVQEWTIASFSWRNKKNPSFLLARISSDSYLISKCFLPNEYTVFFTYLFSILVVICLITQSVFVTIRQKLKKQ